MTHPLRVAIVGGGAAGAIAALHLMAATGPHGADTEIVVYEPRSDLGHGIAYSTGNPRHLLNVVASQMSAFPDDPDDFVRWSGRAADDFAPRSEFGRYLSERLDEARQRHPGMFLHVRATVAAIEQANDCWSVVSSDGGHFTVDSVILALGNPPARVPASLRQLLGTESLVDDPWSSSAFERVRSGDHVVCIGTGLTFVDVALQLCEVDGVTVTGLSRHGLLPRRHGPTGDVPVAPPLDSPLATLRWVRSFGDEWRAAMAALRPLTPALWRSFDDRARRQFLRHPMRFWEVHRHRLAPAVADELDSLMSQGRVNVARGRVISAATSPGGGVLLDMADRTLRADHVVLCTGGEDMWFTSSEVIAGLIRLGHARRSVLDLGIDVDITSGAVTSAGGHATRGLYAIGTIRRGIQWESTAIPEIRMQARDIAKSITN